MSIRQELAKYTTQAQMSSFFIDKIGQIWVSAYGAVGDGATDDTTAVQNAVNAAVAAGISEVNFVGGKTYVITSLTGTTGITFLGTDVTITGGASISVTSLSSHLADYAHVRNYGAVGDGATNDTAAIIAAIAATKGKLLFDGSKTYLVDAFSIANKIVIEGMGATLKCRSACAAFITLQSSVISMSGLIIDGDDKANVGIKILDNLTSVNVKNNEIKNCYRNDTGVPAVYGIHCSLNGTKNISICGNIIHNIHSVANSVIGDNDGVARGINLSYFSTVWVESKDIDISGNFIYDIYPFEDGDGLALNTYNGNKTNVFIHKNHFENCKKRGIKITSGSGHISISDNTIVQTDLATAMYAGISIYGHDVDCRNNKLDVQYSNVGIEVGTGGYGNINVKDNYIELADADTIGSDSVYGIKTTITTTDINVESNEIKFGRYGVELHANVDYLTISNNKFIGTRLAAVRINSFSISALKTLIAIGNVMQTAASTYGIRIQYNAGSPLTIDRLIIIGNTGTYSIFLDIESSITVTHKHQSGNELGEYGLTAARVDKPSISQQFYDTTLGKPIWWNGANWKDAAGTTV